MYNEKHLKTKKKSYDRKMKTSFLDNGVPIEFYPGTCLSLILTDTIFVMSENSFPQLILEDSKCFIKEN